MGVFFCFEDYSPMTVDLERTSTDSQQSEVSSSPMLSDWTLRLHNYLKFRIIPCYLRPRAFVPLGFEVDGTWIRN